MIFRFFVVFTLVFPLPVAAQSTELFIEENTASPAQERKFDFTVYDLHYDCKKCVNDPRGHECIYCDGILTGVATTMGVYEYGRSFCPPENMDTNMVRNFFRRWFLRIDDNLEIVGMRAVPGVIMAMKEMFPCKAKE